MIETQMAVKAKQVSELETQAEYLQRTAPEKMDEIQVKKTQVEMRFEQLKAPLLDRQRQLEKKKEAFQVGSCYFIVVVLHRCWFMLLYCGGTSLQSSDCNLLGCDTTDMGVVYHCYGSTCILNLQELSECYIM
jgi:hypothetical protein